VCVRNIVVVIWLVHIFLLYVGAEVCSIKRHGKSVANVKIRLMIVLG